MEGICESVSEIAKMTSLVNLIRRRRLGEKACYVFSVASICLLTYSVTTAPYFLPYVFTGFVLLCTLNIFLSLDGAPACLHLCYVGNIILLIHIWFTPQDPVIFLISFVLSCGPLLWSVIIFGNALVLHSTKQMHYIYMHIVAPLLCLTIRWYPEETSKFWHQEFESTLLERSFYPAFTWKYFACLFLQRTVHFAVEELFIPVGKRNNVYALASTPRIGGLYKVATMFGPKYLVLMMVLVDTILNILFFLASLFLYDNVVWCCIFMVTCLLIATYNGACFYLHVFSVKDQERYLRSIGAAKEKRG